MREAKSAIMRAPYEFTLRTTAGYTVRFETNKDTFVPSLVVPEALKRGAKVVKQMGNGRVVTEELSSSNAAIRADHDVPTLDPDEQYDDQTVAEESIKVTSDDDAESTAEPSTDFVRYTEREMHIKKSILKLVGFVRSGEPFEEYFVGATGYPKVSKIQEYVPGGDNVTASERDKVINKMKEEGAFDRIAGAAPDSSDV